MTDYPFGDKPVPPQFSMQGEGTAWFFSPSQNGDRTSILQAGHTIPNNIYGDPSLAANVENLTLTGSSAINGTGNGLDNIITGNSGANALTGGLGNDTFNFATGFGLDTVTDFVAGSGVADIIGLSLGAAFDSYDEVIAAASQVGADTVITIDASNKITLTGVLVSALGADDFVFF